MVDPPQPRPSPRAGAVAQVQGRPSTTSTLLTSGSRRCRHSWSSQSREREPGEEHVRERRGRGREDGQACDRARRSPAARTWSLGSPVREQRRRERPMIDTRSASGEDGASERDTERALEKLDCGVGQRDQSDDIEGRSRAYTYVRMETVGSFRMPCQAKERSVFASRVDDWHRYFFSCRETVIQNFISM